MLIIIRQNWIASRKFWQRYMLKMPDAYSKLQCKCLWWLPWCSLRFFFFKGRNCREFTSWERPHLITESSHFFFLPRSLSLSHYILFWTFTYTPRCLINCNLGILAKSYLLFHEHGSVMCFIVLLVHFRPALVCFIQDNLSLALYVSVSCVSSLFPHVIIIIILQTNV